VIIIHRSNLPIVRAFIKYGMKNFSLVILEYTDSHKVISCEQKWINDFKPDYNVNPTAGSSKGYKHTDAAINKIREYSLGRKHTNKVRQNMSESRKGLNNPFYGKSHNEKSLTFMKVAALNRLKSPILGLKVEITDLETKTTTIYDSIRKSAFAINSDIKTILRREKSQIKKDINTCYKNRYMIVIFRN
jgi:group I intron endonuclease